MANVLKRLFSKKQKNEYVKQSLEALEILKYDNNIMPMKDPTVTVEVRDISELYRKLDYLCSDVRSLSKKLTKLEMSLEKLTTSKN